MSSYFRRLADRATAAPAHPPVSAPAAATEDPFERVVYDPPTYPATARATPPPVVPPTEASREKPEPARPAAQVPEPEAQPALTPPSRVEPPRRIVREQRIETIRDTAAEPTSERVVVEPALPATREETIREVRTLERTIEPPATERFETHTLREQGVVRERLERLREVEDRVRTESPIEKPPPPVIERIFPAVEAPPPPEPVEQPRLVIGRLQVDVVPASVPVSAPAAPARPVPRKAAARGSLRPSAPRAFGLRQT